MSGPSSFDIPQLINDDNKPFIMKRLEQEQFPIVKAISPHTIPAFKEILRGVYEGQKTIEEAIKLTEQLPTPPGYRRTRRWAERLVRTELSKIYTMGYGDYLLSIGETECYVPHNNYDADMECAHIIEGKVFSIEEIQNNIYSNVGHRKGMPWIPTVPLHPNCRHIITKVP